MKFGSVDNPGELDLSLPQDHPDTYKILEQNKAGKLENIYVGCAKWGKKDLKGFYPRGTKDELTYYSRQFNSIELNATHYGQFTTEQVQAWLDKTPDNFRFFPKVHRFVTHIKRLKDAESSVESFVSMAHDFNEKLEMCFAQVHDNFKPKDIDRLQNFVEIWPNELPLAVELRNTDWFNDDVVSSRVYQLFEQYNISNIIVDTAGRRDLLHMRLTTPDAFIRYVGANHETDYSRLDEWVERIKIWKQQGLRNLYFFVHQNIEEESPLLSAYFVEKLNKVIGSNLAPPNKKEEPPKLDL
jgi:uncharacterized protein YecE (DUF72 family)